MIVAFSPEAFQTLNDLALDAARRGVETNMYLLGQRSENGARIRQVIQPGNPLEHAAMTEPDYAAAAPMLAAYAARGEFLLGGAHRHDRLVGPSGGDLQTMLGIAQGFPEYLCVVIATFGEDHDPVITAHHVEGGDLTEDKVLIEQPYSAILPDSVRDERVLWVGVGSGGVLGALQLAKCQPGAITFCDGDRFELRNLQRHLATPKAVGMNKAVWMTRFLHGRTTARCKAIPRSLDQRTAREYTRLIGAHTLVVNATGYPPACFQLSDLCVNQQKICLHVGTFARGAGGIVFLQKPDGPCYRCLYQVDLAPSEDAETLDTLQRFYSYSERELSAALGLWSDTAVVAAVQAKVLLQLLKGENPTHNLFVIDNVSLTIRSVTIQRRQHCYCKKGESQ